MHMLCVKGRAATEAQIIRLLYCSLTAQSRPHSLFGVCLLIILLQSPSLLNTTLFQVPRSLRWTNYIRPSHSLWSRKWGEVMEFRVELEGKGKVVHLNLHCGLTWTDCAIVESLGTKHKPNLNSYWVHVVTSMLLGKYTVSTHTVNKV